MLQLLKLFYEILMHTTTYSECTYNLFAENLIHINYLSATTYGFSDRV